MLGGRAGFFDVEEHLRWLSAVRDPLERLRAVAEFEASRAELEAALPRLTSLLAIAWGMQREAVRQAQAQADFEGVKN